MVLAKATFGKRGSHKRLDLEDAMETYLARLLHAGQLCGEYFYAWTNGVLTAYAHLPEARAPAAGQHSKWGKESLRLLRSLFGKDPCWILLEHDSSPQPRTWKKAPFLYLFTNAFDSAPPVCRGDNGARVPTYQLPLPFRDKEGLYFWQGSYASHDEVWLGSGALELPAYRELADPRSELSQDGRQLCREIEKATGVPTFYYLQRYWRRAKSEDERPCPSCGGAWRTGQPASGEVPFWDFPLRCDRCRLVSHLGVSTEGGSHCRIGEWSPRRRNVTRRSSHASRPRA